MNEQSIRGVLSPVLTPFNRDYSVATSAFVSHCENLVKRGVGLAIFGTNSEANSLSVNERMNLLNVLCEHGISPTKIMPGTGCCSISDSIELTKHAVNAGCTGVLMLPPFYYKDVSEEGIFRAYATVIDAVSDERLRIYLYNIPHVTQVPIRISLVERLIKKYPNVIAGIKDSSGDWGTTSDFIETFKNDGFDVFAGSEVFLLQTLRHGGAGCITATGNVNTTKIVKLYETWSDPDADEQQEQLNSVRQIFQQFSMIPAMKRAVSWQTGRSTWSYVRPPLVELDEKSSEHLERDLSNLDFRLYGD